MAGADWPMNHNPFAQPKNLTAVHFTLHERDLAQAGEALDGIALATSAIELDADLAQWRLTLLCEGYPQAEITARLALMEQALGLALAPPEVVRVEPRDWIAHVQHQFPPQRVARFFVHGHHHAVPPSAIGLLVEAGMAFGTGEHATTRRCLEVIDQLARTQRGKNMLDMGCGSAILAIALAKRLHAQVLAVDLDPVAVRVANDNARINRVARQVKAIAGNGYAHRTVRAGAPYDLIIANILARPLMKFARYAAAALRPGGTLVLAGMLQSQLRGVLSAHRMQGFRLVRRVGTGEWPVVILKK